MHPRIIGSLALFGSVSLAVANDVVSLILPMVDQQPLVGEVIGSNGPMTTYVISCPDGADSDECGLEDGMTVTAGPSTFIYEYSFDDYWLRESCKHRSTTWVSCEVTNTQSDFSTVTADATSVDLPYVPVTITATATDADVSTTATASSTSAVSTKSDSESESESSSNTPSKSASTSNQPSESASPTTGSGADAEETSSDNAAMAQTTGSAAQWLVSGAGMALALALA